MGVNLLAILSAMPEENESVLSAAHITETFEKAGRRYHLGTLFDQPVIITFSGWGKVAAAISTSEVIRQGAKEIILIGIAGSPVLEIGDLVIGKNIWQHDVDASPFFKKYEIPTLNKSCFETCCLRRKMLMESSQTKVVEGDIASGDLFISNKEQALKIIEEIPSVVCFEMEGGSVAQVAWEHNVPFSIIRVISDKMESHHDFPEFAKKASSYIVSVLKNVFARSCKCNEAKATILEWLNKQSHERCWYYPDLFKKLATIFDIKSSKEPCLPPLEEFKLGCKLYQTEEYCKKNDIMAS